MVGQQLACTLFLDLPHLPFSDDPAHLYPAQNPNDSLFVSSTGRKPASQQKRPVYIEVMVLILYYTHQGY